jgi:hypothetical protein
MEQIIHIENKILVIRGQKVMLDSDLAILYQVPVKRLNESVKRNIKRFPADFMFQITKEERDILKSQFATSSSHGGRRKLPYVFTEHGVAMLSSVLSSERAIAVNIEIMRAFGRIRQIISSNIELLTYVKDLENEYDEQFLIIFEVLEKLMNIPKENERLEIGFVKNG